MMNLIKDLCHKENMVEKNILAVMLSLQYSFLVQWKSKKGNFKWKTSGKEDENNPYVVTCLGNITFTNRNYTYNHNVDAKANASTENNIKAIIGNHETQVTLLPPRTTIELALDFCCQPDAES